MFETLTAHLPARRDLAPLTVTHRHMWQTIIELCCRHTNVSQALLVFDDWKAASLIHIQVRSAAYLWTFCSELSLTAISVGCRFQASLFTVARCRTLREYCGRS